ncbi:MAG: helix-hairpin-helix domain-containing protein [Cyanobacteria bacterium J06648_10]
MIQTTLFPHTVRQLFSLSNDDIANVFERVADLLEAQGDDYYRIRAYRKGAVTIRSHARSVVDLFEAEGIAGLQQIPYIGKGLSQAIRELAETGNLQLLERLSIDVSPEDLFTTVPGIGQILARRLYRGLGLRSLVDLQQAAQNGALHQVPGFGQERIARLQVDLNVLLQSSPASRESSSPKPSVSSPVRRQKALPTALPSVDLLLKVDEQYRYLAKAGQLRMVTPKRFNPDKKPWLPVMQMRKAGWLFNVLYSNTARAHELGKTHDWVVINYERTVHGQTQRGQCTVVTEPQGAHKGTRVVRRRDASAA